MDGNLSLVRLQNLLLSIFTMNMSKVKLASLPLYKLTASHFEIKLLF